MCQNKNDCSEKLQIVIITRKRIVSSSVWSNDTTLSLVFIIRKSKFPWFPERSVQFSGKRTKRSVQKKTAHNTYKAGAKG